MRSEAINQGGLGKDAETAVSSPGHDRALADRARRVAAARKDFAAVPVGLRVNDVRNDDPGLLERVPAAATGDLFGAS